MSNIKKYMFKIYNNEYFAFFAVSVFFAFVFSMAEKTGDDVGGMLVKGTFFDYWKASLQFYQTWSSRIFINIGVFIFTAADIRIWAVFMGVTVFVLMMACSMLFATEEKRLCNNFIACMTLLFPYQILNSAGWISTMNTYFVPVAFGLMALVPIKKHFFDEKLRLGEYPIYLLCTLYAANNEQMMVVLMGCYVTAALYCFLEKKNSIYIWLILAVCISEAIFIMICPGNASRNVIETARWFPTYSMMGIFDKFELGYSTAMEWLWFKGHIFIVVVVVQLMVFIFEKYEDWVIRSVSVFPVVLVLYNMATCVHYQQNQITADRIVPYFGLINPLSIQPSYLIRYVVVSMVLVCISIEILLLCSNVKQVIVCMSFLVFGVASRIAMGFSSTIYASGERTSAVMGFLIIVLMEYVFSIVVRTRSGMLRQIRKSIMPALGIVSLLMAGHLAMSIILK